MSKSSKYRRDLRKKRSRVGRPTQPSKTKISRDAHKLSQLMISKAVTHHNSDIKKVETEIEWEDDPL